MVTEQKVYFKEDIYADIRAGSHLEPSAPRCGGTVVQR